MTVMAGARAHDSPGPSPRALPETCDVTPSERKNCGFPGITSAQCAARGCCFNSAVRGVPWCFSPAAVDKNGSEGDGDEGACPDRAAGPAHAHSAAPRGPNPLLQPGFSRMVAAEPPRGGRRARARGAGQPVPFLPFLHASNPGC